MSVQKWPSQLVIVRHGESLYNYVKHNGRKRKNGLEWELEGRDIDTPLTEQGFRQAFKTGKGLKQDCYNFDICFASPYLRTRQTLEAITEGYTSRIPFLLEERIREKEYGILDGLTREGIQYYYPMEFDRRERIGKYYYRPPGGESMPDVGLRLQSHLQTLTREYRGQNVLVVTHSIVMLVYRRLLERLPEEQVLDLDLRQEIRNCSITEYACNPALGKNGKMELKRFNEVYYYSELS